jgi:hypothetical protein
VPPEVPRALDPLLLPVDPLELPRSPLDLLDPDPDCEPLSG